MCRVIDACANDSKAAIAVAECNWNGHLHRWVLHQAFGVGKGDVSHRHIHVINAGQDELNWTAFRTDHEIDASGIAREALLHLCTEQQQDDDRRHA